MSLVCFVRFEELIQIVYRPLKTRTDLVLKHTNLLQNYKFIKQSVKQTHSNPLFW